MNNLLTSRTSIILGFLMSFMAFYPRTSQAEGTQAWGSSHGVNRVVWSNPGYVESRATFTGVDFQLPKDENGIVTAPEDKPTFYVGGAVVGTSADGKIYKVHQVDAGIQWEPVKIFSYEPGWSAIISHGGFTNPSECIGINTKGLAIWSAWRKYEPNSDFTLRFRTNLPSTLLPQGGTAPKGRVSLDISGLGEFSWVATGTARPLAASIGEVWPSVDDGSRVYDDAQLDNVSMKRVMGMTQAGGVGEAAVHDLDGSWMQATIINAGVVSYSGAQSSWQWIRANGTTASIVYQGTVGTGHDVANANSARDAVVTVGATETATAVSRHVIEFPNLDAVAGLSSADLQNRARSAEPASEALTEGQTSRYNRETVRVNLRTATRFIGTPSTAGGSAP